MGGGDTLLHVSLLEAVCTSCFLVREVEGVTSSFLARSIISKCSYNSVYLFSLLFFYARVSCFRGVWGGSPGFFGYFSK